MRSEAVNTAGGGAVERWVPKLPGVMGIALCLVTAGATGCVEVEGGAVELSWSLRSFAGESIQACRDARIEEVRLCWTPLEADGGEVSGGCRPPNLESFACEAENGVTGFEIPPGRTSLEIQPVCAGGRPAERGTYDVPPPIVRRVREGKVVTLNALLIVASTCSDPGCTCVFEDPPR